jgi:hypothetical protein
MFRLLFRNKRTGGKANLKNRFVGNVLSLLQRNGLLSSDYVPTLFKPDQDNAAIFVICLLIED